MVWMVSEESPLLRWTSNDWWTFVLLSHQERRTIVRQDERPANFYIILSGSAIPTYKRATDGTIETLDVLKRGSTFGVRTIFPLSSDPSFWFVCSIGKRCNDEFHPKLYDHVQDKTGVVGSLERCKSTRLGCHTAILHFRSGFQIDLYDQRTALQQRWSTFLEVKSLLTNGSIFHLSFEQKQRSISLRISNRTIEWIERCYSTLQLSVGRTSIVFSGIDRQPLHWSRQQEVIARDSRRMKHIYVVRKGSLAIWKRLDPHGNQPVTMRNRPFSSEKENGQFLELFFFFGAITLFCWFSHRWRRWSDRRWSNFVFWNATDRWHRYISFQLDETRCWLSSQSFTTLEHRRSTDFIRRLCCLSRNHQGRKSNSHHLPLKTLDSSIVFFPSPSHSQAWSINEIDYKRSITMHWSPAVAKRSRQRRSWHGNPVTCQPE